MDLSLMMLLVLHITNTFARRKHRYSSEESSIENLLFYQDCKHNAKTPPPQALRNKEPPPPACPCPRMCCSMCCDCNVSDKTEMGRNSMSMMSGLMGPQGAGNPVQPMMSSQAVQPQPNMPKRQRFGAVPSRRTVGFTKNDIKNLISKDEDIKKILKDLVRVTMQKVDLVGMVSTYNSVKAQGKVEKKDDDIKESEEDELE